MLSPPTGMLTGLMSQTSIERLTEYLVQLPPQSQALLMREFERALERGEDTTVATFVLEQLRKIVRGADEEVRPRIDDPARLLFRPLEPFLVEGNAAVRPGQVRRSSLLPVWQWLNRDGAPEQAREFEAALEKIRQTGTTPELEPAVRKFQRVAADAIVKIASPVLGDDKPRALGLALLWALALLARTPGVNESSAYALRFTSGRELISFGETVRPSSAEVV